MLKNSIKPMNNKLDVVKVNIEKFMKFAKYAIHIIIKIADVNAKAIFILIKSSP